MRERESQNTTKKFAYHMRLSKYIGNECIVFVSTISHTNFSFLPILFVAASFYRIYVVYKAYILAIIYSYDWEFFIQALSIMTTILIYKQKTKKLYSIKKIRIPEVNV